MTVMRGPRPLGFHLWTALATWTTSLGALPASRNGSLAWKESLRERAATIQPALAAAEPSALASAVEDEARLRLARFLDGIEAYRCHPYTRTLADPPVLWREGTTRVLDFGGEGAPVFVVPSLINRSTVLDLAPGRSLVRHLKAQGLRALLVDWDAPGAEERGFDLDAYIAGRLSRALAAAREAAGPPAVIGYCMGGNLALGLAAIEPRSMRSLTLLATPWDFHAERAVQHRSLPAMLEPFWPIFESVGEVPVDVLQMLFAALDPMLALRKFTAFAAMTPGSPEAEAFVALEEWANDGVPLAAKVARACLTRWYGANDTAKGQWRVAGTAVDPARIALPTLIVLPERDRIVPPATAAALAAEMPRARVLKTGLGHVGMVVGGKAEAEVWKPLTDWLAQPA
jgi:polyhydroxyalkanoate synthase subunit PhaC